MAQDRPAGRIFSLNLSVGLGDLVPLHLIFGSFSCLNQGPVRGLLTSIRVIEVDSAMHLFSAGLMSGGPPPVAVPVIAAEGLVPGAWLPLACSEPSAADSRDIGSLGSLVPRWMLAL